MRDTHLPRVLMVGNGPYTNRGCEAIVRGTMSILEDVFGVDFLCDVVTFMPQEMAGIQQARERDSRITHWAACTLYDERPPRRGSRRWLNRQLQRAAGKDTAHDPFFLLKEQLKKPLIALQIGGDNYTLDYGLPRRHMALDRTIARWRVPNVLWGASVGPFGSNPLFQEEMREHLETFATILVREGRSESYLTGLGLSRPPVGTADPAFLMPACSELPPEIASLINDGAIGINLSPLMARFSTCRSMHDWVALATCALEEAIRVRPEPFILVPHVTEGFDDAPLASSAESAFSDQDDFRFLYRLYERLPKVLRSRTTVLPPSLDAGQTKGVISRLRLFVGCRTHATIAALSSGVPVAFIAYSQKAAGLGDTFYGVRAPIEDISSFGPSSLRLLLERATTRESWLRAETRRQAATSAALCRCAVSVVKSAVEGQHG